MPYLRLIHFHDTEMVTEDAFSGAGHILYTNNNVRTSLIIVYLLCYISHRANSPLLLLTAFELHVDYVCKTSCRGQNANDILR